ncbi:hypothetical protein KGF57_001671 [Candida theae]|uniref:Small ribosomal subunit protein bS18m n=1 Tax=Candida theae TaxID=1198502 RepID=A0AAD5BH67_9ASCO|nr:uncharacterized protein KGF57_001671 [Candida theae]KAI5961546.1 hypothetical protein KGF57_001671 [Candida theae]
MISQRAMAGKSIAHTTRFLGTTTRKLAADSASTSSESTPNSTTNFEQFKSKQSWRESYAPGSSAQADLTENLSKITQNIASGEPPIHIAQSLQKKFRVGTTYNPFDFSMNRLRMDRKQVQAQQRKLEDPFDRSGIDPRNLYLMPEVLSQFLTSTGQILPRQTTGCSAANQKKLTAAIKTARNLGLLSTVHKHYRFLPSRNL